MHRALLIAAVALLTACAHRPAPVIHTVTIEGMKFQPESLTVKVGDSVVWVNKDLFPHTATSIGGFDSGDIPADKSWTFIATTSGEFPYGCTFHPTMKGQLQVQQ